MRINIMLDTKLLFDIIWGSKEYKPIIQAVERCDPEYVTTEGVLVETLYFTKKGHLDLLEGANRVLSTVKEVRHLGMKPLKDRRIGRLNYVDTELLESLKPNELLLTTDNTLANEAISSQTGNAYSLDWLLILDEENIRKLICGSVE